MVVILRNNNVRHNWQIKVPQVRVIDAEGNQLGVMTNKEALSKAQEAGLDLVEISPTANPPVCKITDYGKYCYSLSKKEKESKKKQKQAEMKEVKFTSKIGEHDYQTKMRNIERFLEKKHKVKITMFFRGREKAHIDLGETILNRITTDLEALAQVDKRTGLEGSAITVILSPKS